MESPDIAVTVNRPAGVTASAVVAILGSVLTLLVAAMMASAPFMDVAQPTDPPNMGAFVIGMAGALGSLAALGIWTAIGLLKLRPWARTSIMVFAGITAIMCVFTLAFVLLMPFPAPPNIDASKVLVVKSGMIVIFAIPALIGAWWLIQFNRPGTKLAFASSSPMAARDRPLSVAIIGWMQLLGGVFSVIPMVAATPLFLAGAFLTGWPARSGYALLGAVGIYTGWGLLRLNETARKVALASLSLSALNGMLITLLPSAKAKMIAFQKTVPQGELDPSTIDFSEWLNISMLFGFLLSAAGIWFLVKNKPAFEHREL